MVKCVEHERLAYGLKSSPNHGRNVVSCQRHSRARSHPCLHGVATRPERLAFIHGKVSPERRLHRGKKGAPGAGMLVVAPDARVFRPKQRESPGRPLASLPSTLIISISITSAILLIYPIAPRRTAFQCPSMRPLPLLLAQWRSMAKGTYPRD